MNSDKECSGRRSPGRPPGENLRQQTVESDADAEANEESYVEVNAQLCDADASRINRRSARLQNREQNDHEEGDEAGEQDASHLVMGEMAVRISGSRKRKFSSLVCLKPWIYIETLDK